MLDLLFLLLGISGVIAIALNFVLESADKLGKDHKTFAWINLYGCSALFAYSYYESVWLFVVLNAFLIAVGVYGLYKVYFRNSHLARHV